MPVTTTVQNILDWAYAKSLKNQPGFIATESAELLEQFNRVMRALYSIAASHNPTFFGVKATLTEASLTWPIPEDAESVYWLEQGGAEVIVVPIWDKSADPSKLTVFSTGRVLEAAGVNDPAASDLDCWYSKRADVETSLSDTLDATWDESFNELVVLELALYLSVKDGREEEYAGLIAMRDRELARFVARLRHEYANLRSKFGPTLQIQTSETVNPSELLIGHGG